jgi:hypothetical protein
VRLKSSGGESDEGVLLDLSSPRTILSSLRTIVEDMSCINHIPRGCDVTDARAFSTMLEQVHQKLLLTGKVVCPNCALPFTWELPKFVCAPKIFC